MKTAELSGHALDEWAARADGHAVRRQVGGGAQEQWPPGNWLWIRHPSTSWADGGPLIERERIELLPNPYGPKSPYGGESWFARLDGGERVGEGRGDTALIAAMRAFVASKFGEEVPDQ